MPGGKQKTKKSTQNSTESDDDSEHELFHYANDRIRLMKEVLKLIKPKKIKSIAPDFMKNSDIDEINSILLEELLGISNKRLKHILNGDNDELVSTSSDSEAEQKPIDVISLDDISDTDDEFGLGSVNNSNVRDDSKGSKNKGKHKPKKKLKEIKKEKGQSSKTKEPEHHPEVEENKLMNVLEILELQARARAIRSQLALENMNKKQENVEKLQPVEEDDDDTAIIVSSPQNEEIVITSSDSEEDDNNKKLDKTTEANKDKTENTSSEGNDMNKSNNQKDVAESAETISNIKETEEIVSVGDVAQDKEISKQKASDEAGNTKCNNDPPVIEGNKSCNNDNNDATYKSDSDNDVINLDSEDIDN